MKLHIIVYHGPIFIEVSFYQLYLKTPLCLFDRGESLNIKVKLIKLEN